MIHFLQASSHLNLINLHELNTIVTHILQGKKTEGSSVIRLPKVRLIHGRAGMEVWPIWSFSNYALLLKGRQNQSHLSGQ